MTCKDCGHYDVCRYWGNEDETEDGIPDCPDFKDKTRFVELPCKAGDILYEITERRIKSHWVKCIVRRVVLRIEVGLNGYISAKCGTTISVPLQNIGKTVFLTLEDAEEKLKEKS